MVKGAKNKILPCWSTWILLLTHLNMMIGKVRRGWELFEAAAHRGDVPVYQGRVDEGLTESESEDEGQGDESTTQGQT